MGDKVEQAKGKAKEVAGWAAGDREFEAEGKLDQLDAQGASGEADSAEQAADEAEKDVREEHGELRR